MDKKFFPACNSGIGFKSYFNDIFKNLNRLYIIKGGPGTGKSKLMRDIANEAKNKEYDVEYYYCSSDPESLDGIIIRDIGIGMLDGTAPHTHDPKLPGAYDEIVNLGDFWSADKLARERPMIDELTNRKADLYSQAYHNLSIISLIDREISELIEPAVDMDKLKGAASRLVKSFNTGSGTALYPRLLISIGMNGVVSFNTFYELADKHYILHDRYGIAGLFFNEVLKTSESKCQPAYISYSPFDLYSADALYFPEMSMSFTSAGNRSQGDKLIDTQRFIKLDTLRNYRQKINFAKKCRSSVLDDTLDIFSRIRELHFELEKFTLRLWYSNAKRSILRNC